MYLTDHNVFIASSGQCCTKLKVWLHAVPKIPSCVGSHLHQCQYLLAA